MVQTARHHYVLNTNMRVSEFVDKNIDEMALKSFKTFGDFTKPGPFNVKDRRLISHPEMPMKAKKAFQNTPYDFRLFFTNVRGKGKYSEHGLVNPKNLGDYGFSEDEIAQILDGHEDAITIVYVANRGIDKVILTPWIMAHRFGHSIVAARPWEKERHSYTWKEAEEHFFNTVNNYYRIASNALSNRNIRPIYVALFNNIGVQRSSRKNLIKRPYEFLYELFAQYLNTGHVKLKPLPAQLGYGSKAWGKHTKYITIDKNYADESIRKELSDTLARDMELLFNGVLSSCVGKIYLM